MLREGKTGDWVGTYLGHKGSITCARVTKTGSNAVSTSTDFTFKKWNSKGGILFEKDLGCITRCCDMIEGKYIVIGAQNGAVYLYDFETCHEILQFQLDTVVKSALFINDKILVCVTTSGTVSWIDISAGNARVLSQSKVEPGPVSQAERHLENQMIVCSGQRAYIFDVASFSIIKTFSFDYTLNALAVSHDNMQYLTANANDTWVRLYDYNTNELLDTYKGHHGPVHSIAYSPDGAVAATGSEDGTVRIWKMTDEKYGLWSDGPNGW